MSPKKVSKCVVPGCKTKDVVCHRFPNPRTNKARLLAWMKIIGLEDLDCHAVYSKKVICAVHFAEDCSSPGTKRLNANLYPTLKLPFLHSTPSKPTSTLNGSNHVVFSKDFLHSTPSKSTSTLNGSNHMVVSKDVGGQYHRISDSIAYYICKDNKSFSTVEGKGFLYMMKQVCPLYNVPSRNTMKNIIDQKYEIVENRFRMALQNVNHFSLTTDI